MENQISFRVTCLHAAFQQRIFPFRYLLMGLGEKDPVEGKRDPKHAANPIISSSMPQLLDHCQMKRFVMLLSIKGSDLKNNSVHDDAAVMRQMLLDQAYLDKQFMLLEQLEKDGNPNFVRNIFGLYFEDTERYVQTVEHCLKKVLLDDEDLDRALYHLKGSSACIGANKVKIEVNQLRALCKEKDVETERCKEVLQNLKRERAELKDKMDNYFQLLRSAEPE